MALYVCFDVKWSNLCVVWEAYQASKPPTFKWENPPVAEESIDVAFSTTHTPSNDCYCFRATND